MIAQKFGISSVGEWLSGLLKKGFSYSSGADTPDPIFDGLEPDFLEAIERNKATPEMLDTSQKVAAYATCYSKEALGEGPINGMAPIIAAERIAAAINDNPDLLDETSAQAVLNLANERAYHIDFPVSAAPSDINLNYTLRDHGEDRITKEHFASLKAPIKPSLFIDCMAFLPNEAVNAFAVDCTDTLGHRSERQQPYTDTRDIQRATAGLGVAISKNPDLLNEETAVEILRAACQQPSVYLDEALKKHGEGIISDDTFDQVVIKGSDFGVKDFMPGNCQTLEACAAYITSDALMPYLNRFEQGRSVDTDDFISLIDTLRKNPDLVDEQSSDKLKSISIGPQVMRHGVDQRQKLVSLLEQHASQLEAPAAV